MEPWEQAIRNHKILLRERPDVSYWSDNIIDSTHNLSEPADWQKFYLYLTQSPRFFDKTQPVVGPTLGQLEHVPEIPDYDENQEVECVQNGDVTFIMVNTVCCSGDDDEKVCS